MNRYLLICFVLLCACQGRSQQYSYFKKDSSLTVWANDLARYSIKSCNEVTKMERDSAVKLVTATMDPGTGHHPTARGLNGEVMYVHDSTAASFFFKERINPELLK